jgi:hypothetical protein
MFLLRRKRRAGGDVEHDPSVSQSRREFMVRFGSVLVAGGGLFGLANAADDHGDELGYGESDYGDE